MLRTMYHHSVSPKDGNDCSQRCSDGPVRRVAGHPARAFVHGVSLPQPLMSWLGPVVGQKWPSGVFAPVLLALYSHPTVKRTPLPLARVPVFLCIAARKYSRLLVKCSSFLRKYSRLLVKCSSFLRKYSRLLVKYSSCLRKYSRLLVKCSSLRVCVSLRRFS